MSRRADDPWHSTSCEAVTSALAPLITGLIGAVVLPVVGVGVGAAQIVRGVANTPSAIKQARPVSSLRAARHILRTQTIMYNAMVLCDAFSHLACYHVSRKTVQHRILHAQLVLMVRGRLKTQVGPPVCQQSTLSHASRRPTSAQASQGKSWDNRQRVWVDDPGTALALDDEAFAGVRQQWNASAIMRYTSSCLAYLFNGLRRLGWLLVRASCLS